MRDAINAITVDMVADWTEDLLFVKTFSGLYVQPAVLSAVADKMGLPWRSATPTEEARGIDGYIGRTAVSVKPASYSAMGGLSEEIEAPIIRYNKTKTKIAITFDEEKIR